MIVQVGVGNGDPFSSVGDIEKTVQIILASAEVAREIAVVNPDVGGLVNANGIAVVSVDLADFQVTHDNIANLADVESNASNSWKGQQMSIFRSMEYLQLPDSP